MKVVRLAWVLTLALMIMPPTTVAQTLEQLWQQGETAQAQKKYPEAERIWRQIIQLDPNSAVAFSNLCAALFRQNKLDEALIFCQKALALDPKLPETYKNIGNVLYGQKKLTEAEEMYRRAIALDDKYVDAYNNLGNVLSDQKKLKEAEEMFRRALALDDKFVYAYNNLGAVLYNQKKLTEAEEMYRRSLDLPDDTTGTPTTPHTLAHNNLGRLLQEQGKLEAAIAEFEKATKIDPKFEFATNNLQEARRLLSLQQQPEQIIALNNTKYLPQEDPLTRIKRSIVKISVVFTGNAKGTAYGTGYVIKRRGTTVWIITNRHVVVDRDTEQRGDNLEVEPYYGENLPNLPRDRVVAKIIHITQPQENLDLALLEVTGLPDDISPLTFHQGEINPQTPISIIGHPESKDWSKYEAITIGIQSSSGNLLIDVSLAVGGSGSPVFDQEMRVIGLMFKTINESQIDSSGIGFAYPIDRILQKLAQWQVVVP
ncbi:tetratricopeptide repeat protein [Microcystis sp. LE19-59.1C]|uniref:tetratricopeptide repeat protein n=1 Tax=Microcystis sp. LE19-59.1C TaxID=3016442 RepID=UPI0022C3FA20|nr:tetratricopeptide repeat protein [Microcystis sp. LE19-59.1C]MCZ8287408.1 tetratricopeptide repeat protein [Microcystis sp. LE19-59.1C]